MTAETDQLPPAAAEVQLRELRAVLADTQRELTRARADERQAVSELADFKVRVRDTAIDYGSTYGWCQVLDEALADLGLPPATGRYAVDITITGWVSPTVNGTDQDSAAQTALDAAGIGQGRIYDLLGLPFQVQSVAAECEPGEVGVGLPPASRTYTVNITITGRVSRTVEVRDQDSALVRCWWPMSGGCRGTVIRAAAPMRGRGRGCWRCLAAARRCWWVRRPRGSGCGRFRCCFI